jgi:hypothetical protein
MSEKLLKFFVAQLNIARLHCPTADCKVVFEVPVGELDRVRGLICPICNQPIHVLTDSSDHPLALLARAIRGLKDKNINVEFVMPKKD